MVRCSPRGRISPMTGWRARPRRRDTSRQQRREGGREPMPRIYLPRSPRVIPRQSPSCSRAAVLHEPGSTRRSTVAGESPVRGCAVSADGVARRSKLPELDKQEVKALIRTALCDLLGIEHPIIQAGMGPFAPASLAAHEGRGRMGRARRSAPPEEAYGLLEGCGALSRCPHGGLRRRFCCGGNDHYCSSG